MPSLYAFHALLHPRPEAVSPASAHADRWGVWPALAAGPAALAGTFPVGFEAVLEHLEKLPRMVVEPDGAIVWRGASAAADWQVEGTLRERQGRLASCELQGTCPPEALDRLLSAAGWPATAVMFELVRAGVFLEEPTFRRHALARWMAGAG